MRKRRYSFRLFLFVSFACSRLGVSAQDIHFNTVSPPGNYPGIITKAMTQDIHGYLWIATSDGLFKYDGRHYTAYHHEALNPNTPAAADNEWIMADKTGDVWVALHYAGLDRLDPVTGIFTHFRHDPTNPGSLSSDSVWVVIQDHEGAIWVGTNRGLEKFDPTTNKFTHYRNDPTDPASLSCDMIRAMYEDREGNIWVGTGDAFELDRPTAGGLNKLNKATGKFTRYQHDDNDPHSLTDNKVRSILEDSHGNFWIGTAGDGLHTMDRQTGKFERHLFDPKQPGKLSRPALKNTLSYGVDHISFINEDSKGKIWIGTFEGGLNVYDPATQQVSHYGTDSNSTQKMEDDGYWASCKTTDGTLWVSSLGKNNLYKINPVEKTIPHVNRQTVVIAFLEDDDQSLWLTTFKGLVHQDKNGKEERYLITDDINSVQNQLYAINKGDGEKIWVTTYTGLFIFDKSTKTFQAFRHQPGNTDTPSSDTVFYAIKGLDDQLWICTYRGLDAMNTKTGKFIHYLNDPKDTFSISGNNVFSVTIDSDRNVWACSFTGLSRLDKKTGHWKRFLNNSKVSRLFEDRQGNIWAGLDIGLCRYNKKTDEFLSFNDPSFVINTSAVFWIVEDKFENLWLNNGQGIVRLNKGRTIATLFAHNQQVGSTNSTTSGYARRNGDILFGDTTGYYLFKSADLHQNIAAPTVLIHNFLLNDVPVLPASGGILSAPLTQTKELRLNYLQNNFSIEFANIDFFSDPEDIRLLYRLENYDNTWRGSPDEQKAYYFNLPPGKYIFKVMAINAAGITTERSIGLMITPPWWKTWGAYSLAALILLALVYGLYRNRTNQIRRKQSAQLNIMVAAQEGERRRISRDLHDDVGTKLSALKLSLSSLHEKASDTGNEEIKSLAESASQFITEVMQDVRQLLANLSPAVLEEFGYTTAVEALVEKINQTRQIHFDLVVFGIKERLKQDYELALYRITQELISNVLKHADAKNVSLQIGQRDQQVILMIEDDGKGFDVNAHKGGYGLHNLEARTKLLHGTMVIDSQPGKGTSVLIEVPYQ